MSFAWCTGMRLFPSNVGVHSAGANCDDGVLFISRSMSEVSKLFHPGAWWGGGLHQLLNIRWRGQQNNRNPTKKDGKQQFCFKLIY